MPASHVVLILLGGVGAGIFNGVAGGGSLISFPILLGLGYPALTANITNTIGIWPGYVASAAGYRKRDRRPGPAAGPPHPDRPGRRRGRRTAAAHDLTGDIRRRRALARLGGRRPVRRPTGIAAGPGPRLVPSPHSARAAGGGGVRRLGLRRLLRCRHGRDVPRRARPRPARVHRPHQRAAGRAVDDRQRHRGRRVPHPWRPGLGGGGAARRWAASSGATSGPAWRWRSLRPPCGRSSWSSASAPR